MKKEHIFVQLNNVCFKKCYLQKGQKLKVFEVK